MRRVTRKKLKQDEFVSIVDQMIQWFSENWRAVAAAAGAALVVFFLWWGLSTWSGHRKAAASEALARTLEQLDKAKTEDARADAEDALREVIEKYGSTPQADEARVVLARILAEQGKTDEARQLLTKVAHKRNDSPMVRVATLDLIGLQVNSGQAAEVIPQLEAMVTGKDPRLPRDLALYQLAEVQAEEGNIAKAKEYLQKLMEDFPESPYAGQARRKLQELG